MDDEYKWAGVEDPKIMITTSRDPSSRLKMFAKVSVWMGDEMLAKPAGNLSKRDEGQTRTPGETTCHAECLFKGLESEASMLLGGSA
jgi:hypothetical protein